MPWVRSTSETLPLSALLSWVLVAFTIEFDNEAEHRLPHRTTNHGPTPDDTPHKPWLTSLVMWFNCMRFVSGERITVRDLESLARTPTNLHGMQRWGYIKVAPDPNAPKPPRSAWLIHPTRAGLRARQIWEPLLPEIEQRWCDRFGQAKIQQLRNALTALTSQLEGNLPDCLPILGHGFFVKNSRPGKISGKPDSSLVALLSKLLLTAALDFEKNSQVSLPLSANLFRVIPSDGALVRDLPGRSGVSKEAIAVGLSYSLKHGYANLQPGPPKKVHLTGKGEDIKAAYQENIVALEQNWEHRYGKQSIDNLRQSLHPLIGEPTSQSSLFECLQPYPDGWRAAAPKPATLPHYPLVLHRGGYPDGS
jgi:hypothetical protein